jgi:glutathione S-transferase
MTIWDSLAICEYLAEQFPELHLWPQDVAARAMARSVCAEMHAGFSDCATRCR